MLTIATCAQYPQLSQNLQELYGLLSPKFNIHITPWQNLPLNNFILPLCCWDYAQQAKQFIHWLNIATKNGVDFFNPTPLLAWNMNKNYLCDLSKMGVNVIPTKIVQANANAVKQLMQQLQWKNAVIKPLIGQSGKQVQQVNLTNLTHVNWSEYDHHIILQPFIPEIQTQGETSLIFFNGEYSHGIKRQPAQGEWRANSAYGVTIIPIQTSFSLQQQAKAILMQLPQQPIYARIDGILINDIFLVNELELIEPALYLDQTSSATFAQLITDHIINSSTIKEES